MTQTAPSKASASASALASASASASASAIKYDIKKEMPQLYAPKRGQIEHILVPQLSYVSVSGKGSPDDAEFQAAMGALYAVAYPLKFHSKNTLHRDYAVGPAEGLWWADDPAAFVRRDKSQWQWTLLSVLPPWIHESDYAAIQESAIAKALGIAAKDGSTEQERAVARAVQRVQFLTLDEGESLQVLHVGPYADETEILNDMHNNVMPARGLTFNGPHHEIYLGDPRRTAPEKLRIILRQPVKRI